MATGSERTAVKLFSYILAFLFVFSTLALAAGGGNPDVLFQGAEQAVSFCIGITGGICLWSAVMELMEQSGVSRALSAALEKILVRLFPIGCRHEHILSAISQNLSANLLGLGNAATPAGIRAAQGLAALGDKAADELCMLVVLNTASIQLIPSTIAAVRSSYGAAAAFDITAAVWISSAISLAVGLVTAHILKKLWR